MLLGRIGGIVREEWGYCQGGVGGVVREKGVVVRE